MAKAKSRSKKVQTAPDPEHKQNPADETIAAGEHMDLEAMDEALEGERRAGAPAPTGVILPAPSTVQNPYVSEEMQGMEMTPKTFGPPQYGSPDPASAASRLMTLEDGHPLAGLDSGTAAISEDYGVGLTESGDQPSADEAALPPGDRAPETGNNPDADTSGNSDVNATDGAKDAAAEHGVNLSDVEGTGEDGRITKADVEKHVAEQDGNGSGGSDDGNNN